MEKMKFAGAVRTLEFDKIREKLAYFAPTQGAKKLALSLMPVTSAIMVKRMLAETDMTVSEISDEVGFSDTSYFSKVFLKSVGKTPTLYRRSKE